MRLDVHPRLSVGFSWVSVCLVIVFSASVRWTFANPPSPLQDVVSVEILPREVRINNTNRQQQLLVTAVTTSGKRFDVTYRCELQVAGSSVASLSGTSVLGASDGTTKVVARLESLRAEVPVVVEGIETVPAVHFHNDIVPLLAKLRCNSSGCHGKASGQNGFRLSVFGFDPHADHNALVKEGRGRRVSPAAPQQSLLFRKATGLVPHGGGQRTEPDSTDAQLICAWIAQGMPWGSDDAPQLASIEIDPLERTMGTRADQQLLVTAAYTDGSRRDVTQAASYTSNADTIAAVDPSGRILTGERPGEAAITVNYMGRVGASRVLVPRPISIPQLPTFAAVGRVDELVWAKLAKLGIQASDLASDQDFLRRLYLDAIGTLPKPDEVRKFITDVNPDKRREAIERVLAREEFADYWALKWADVLLVNSKSLGSRGAFELHRWLRQKIAANRPYDEWVRELITATGNSSTYGPVNFYRALRTPSDVTKTVSQAFLGIRLDCAQCHHHPFEKWGQEDFYGLAGYFTGVERKTLSAEREVIYHKGHEAAKFPLTGREVPTHPLGVAPRDILAADPRIELAHWLTAPENPWFARLVANRIWKHYLGRGLVEPEDDHRSTNPPTNEPLLDYLSGQVVASGYDLKQLMRLILNSHVYHLSSTANETNADDDQNFSHYLAKRLPSEVLLDAISEVTGSPEPFAGFPPGTRSIQLWDNRLPSYFLDTFGRSQRESPCECAKSSDPTMAQALHLMNAPEIQAKIGAPSGRVAKLISAGKTREELVREFCLAALGREPRETEYAVATDLFARQPAQQAAEDFVWTLLNAYEFLFIH